MKMYQLVDEWEVPYTVFANSPKEAMLHLINAYEYGLPGYRKFIEYTLPTDGGPIVLEKLESVDLFNSETKDPFIQLVKRSESLSDWLEEYFIKLADDVPLLVVGAYSKEWAVDKATGDIVYLFQND